jgi:DNA-binding NtrC family response regulator
VVTLKIPPLSERPKDIEVLAQHFIHRYSEANGVEALPLSPESRHLLARHSWPGNVRELENTMHRAVLIAGGDQIEPDAILLPGSASAHGSAGGQSSAQAGSGIDELVGRTVAEVERQLIIDTLSHCLGNRTHAANVLGISIRTLRNKLKQYSGEGFSIPMHGDGERSVA